MIPRTAIVCLARAGFGRAMLLGGRSESSGLSHRCRMQHARRDTICDVRAQVQLTELIAADSLARMAARDLHILALLLGLFLLSNIDRLVGLTWLRRCGRLREHQGCKDHDRHLLDPPRTTAEPRPDSTFSMRARSASARRADERSNDPANGLDFAARPAGLREDRAERVLGRLRPRWRV